jgi:hypothetical protein
VVYYNFVEARSAAELLEAAEIMGITVRIGIEFWARVRDRYAQMIWVLRGFPDSQAFLGFLAEAPVAAFLAAAREVSRYQQRYVTAVLEEFNHKHRKAVTEEYGLEMPPLDPAEFSAFVGTGQASVVHLGEFAHRKMLGAMRDYVHGLKGRYAAAGAEERRGLERIVSKLNALDAEAIIEQYLRPARNPTVRDPNIPAEDEDVPAFLKLTAPQLVERLKGLHPGYRLTLNLTHLTVEDVLEILYDTEGAVTRLEIFNLKDYEEGKTAHLAEINELQRAVNDGDVVHLKRMIRQMLERMEAQGGNRERIEKIRVILHDIPNLVAAYKAGPLKARIGSDSTEWARRGHGMGLAIKETLPLRARREIRRPSATPWEIIPVRIRAFRRTTHVPLWGEHGALRFFFRLARRVPCLGALTEKRSEDWIVEENSIRLETRGNVVALGGMHGDAGNGLTLTPQPRTRASPVPTWNYLNTFCRNMVKTGVGFLPAFLTFYLTREWWLLAYFGAVLWFGITGLRNIIQSVLGGGGLGRSPLLRWNDYVSWDRITDSLLFTGFSVPVLDYAVKTLLLDHTLGVTISTDPMALFAGIALANGLYISGHNAFRGFSRGVIVGNFFRTVLSIPIAVAFNAAAGLLLASAGLAGVDAILQNWAAVISKLASDVVAGAIEGAADRYQNIRIRRTDYREKLRQVFDTYARLELLFPERNALELLHSGELEAAEMSRPGEVRDLRKIFIANALDLLYFWMYQPRARTALKSLWRNLPDEERRILAASQSVLEDYREISQMFVDGLVGRNFSRALSFYLDRSREYLAVIRAWCPEVPAASAPG